MLSYSDHNSNIKVIGDNIFYWTVETTKILEKKLARSKKNEQSDVANIYAVSDTKCWLTVYLFAYSYTHVNTTAINETTLFKTEFR